LKWSDGGFIDEAAAQTRFAEMLAQSEMGRGNAQAGVPLLPSLILIMLKGLAMRLILLR